LEVRSWRFEVAESRRLNTISSAARNLFLPSPRNLSFRSGARKLLRRVQRKSLNLARKLAFLLGLFTLDLDEVSTFFVHFRQHRAKFPCFDVSIAVTSNEVSLLRRFITFTMSEASLLRRFIYVYLERSFLASMFR